MFTISKKRQLSQLDVEETTHNSIYVKWIISNAHQNSGSYKSSPFVLMSERCPISFSLSFNYRTGITVKQTTAKIGRAIITVKVTDGSHINDMKVVFAENWKELCPFSNLGQLPENSNQQTVQKSLPPPDVTIFCKIIWLGFVSDDSPPELPLSPLSIANIAYDNYEYPDFTLIVEEQEIPVHKAILARHSSVLSTMFQIPMKESKNNEVVIEDVEFSAMEVIVDIIYRGETAKLDDIDTALKVLMAAEKYQMFMIKTICECKLQLKITTNNVLKLLQEADKYNAANLCETCVAYIFAVRDPEILWEFERISQTHNIAFAVMNVMKPYGSELIPTEKM